jgi:hypothetical protein
MKKTYLIVSLLYTSEGKTIWQGQLQNEKTRMDICELPVGLYMLQIGNEEKQVFKVLKE